MLHNTYSAELRALHNGYAIGALASMRFPQ